ncbi:hypothetical protein BDQ17DRAFT_1365086 [Cyathus striatus]|nr:hypothetical protein BDQ17DRAFT_1365086 [Cyathus striatus]
MPINVEPTCMILYQAGTWTIMIGMCLAELIFTIRTWAVLGKKKWQGICLLLFFVGTWAAAFAVVALVSESFTFTLQSALHPFLNGCLIKVGRVHYLLFSWIPLFIYEGVLMILMLVPGYEFLVLNSGHSKLVRVVFRDVMTSANLIITKQLSSDYFTIILMFAILNFI